MEPIVSDAGHTLPSSLAVGLNGIDSVALLQDSATLAIDIHSIEDLPANQFGVYGALPVVPSAGEQQV
jgi:hypothetical protein